MEIVALGFLTVAGLGCLVRLLRRGGSIADRIVALDTLLIVVVSGLAVQAARSGDTSFIDVMVIAALLAFTGTALVAKFIERKG